MPSQTTTPRMFGYRPGSITGIGRPNRRAVMINPIRLASSRNALRRSRHNLNRLTAATLPMTLAQTSRPTVLAGQTAHLPAAQPVHTGCGQVVVIKVVDRQPGRRQPRQDLRIVSNPAELPPRQRQPARLDPLQRLHGRQARLSPTHTAQVVTLGDGRSGLNAAGPCINPFGLKILIHWSTSASPVAPAAIVSCADTVTPCRDTLVTRFGNRHGNP